MKLLRIFFTQSLFVLLFYFSATAQSDNPVLNQIIAKSAKIYNSFPIEKVYLHFDKPYYAIGDTLWFKAYLTVGQHLPSALSRIIYVDVLGPRDSLIQSLKLQVKNSVTWNSIPISQYVYKKGNYRIVAYTNWMNNTGVDYFFSKTIAIGDAINNAVSTQFSVKSAIVSKFPKITAGIYYKDDDGKPYAGKRVSWTVQKEDETLFKGKGETDQHGFIEISFFNSKNFGLDSASITTVIETGTRKPVTNSFPLKSIASPNDIQFFPEGGELLQGVRTKIAFKAIRPTGLGIDLKGTITDNNNNVICEFSSSHLGMGYFLLTPEDGKSYNAKITYADGSTATPVLPRVQTNGINLSLDNSSTDLLGVRLQADQSFFNENKDKTFFIICKSEGAISFAAKTTLAAQVYNAKIPKSKFPTGIVQVTLFTADGDPLSERVAFIQHNDLLNVSVGSDQPSYITRQKVKLNITAKNNDQPDEGNFSVAVVDESKVPYDENAETTILSYILLTSDIKGYIEKPNYYFNHPDEKTVADLDVLMQTQGYRRFSYDGILNNRYPQLKFLPEQGIDISGTLRASTGMPVNNGNITLSIANNNYYKNTVTDADGHYKFPNLVFLDSAKIKLSARNNFRSNDLVLFVDGEQGQSVGQNFYTPDEILNIDSVLSAYLKNSKIEYKSKNILKEVVIRDTKIVPTVTHLDYGSLSSLSHEADHTITAAQLQGCNSVFECLKGMAMGMTFQNNNFYVFTNHTNSASSAPAAIFVKGMIADVNYLSTLNPADVESIEIFVKDELGLINSAYNTNGAIVINMKKAAVGTKLTVDQIKDLIPQSNERTITPRGYTPVKTFYMPRYAGPRAAQTTKVDTRSTIYWNPNVITDKTGNAAVEYFNADGKGTYRAIVEGMDKDGNIGRQVFKYEVK